MARKIPMTAVSPRPQHLGVTPARELRSPLPEHSMVCLSTRCDLGDGRTLPAGALGAVVFVHAGGQAYEVEFIEPFHTVTTVLEADLRKAPSA